MYGYFNGLGDLIWQDGAQEWHLTPRVIIPEPLHPDAHSNLVPCSGMTLETFNRERGNEGSIVYTGSDGVVTVAIQESEIPVARHTVAPNFAPTDDVLGFTCARPDGSSPQAPYTSPNGSHNRPALFPSIDSARGALSWPQTRLGPRVYYSADTPEELSAYLAQLSAGTRDEAKEGSIGS